MPAIPAELVDEPAPRAGDAATQHDAASGSGSGSSPPADLDQGSEVPPFAVPDDSAPAALNNPAGAVPPDDDSLQAPPSSPPVVETKAKPSEQKAPDAPPSPPPPPAADPPADSSHDDHPNPNPNPNPNPVADLDDEDEDERPVELEPVDKKPPAQAPPALIKDTNAVVSPPEDKYTPEDLFSAVGDSGVVDVNPPNFASKTLDDGTYSMSYSWLGGIALLLIIIFVWRMKRSALGLSLRLPRWIVASERHRQTRDYWELNQRDSSFGDRTDGDVDRLKSRHLRE